MRTDPSLRFSSGYKPPGLNLPGRTFQDGVSQSGHERNHLFLSTGSGFADVAGISGADSPADGRSLTLLDFDRDGWQDLALVNANAPMFELYRNQMSGLRPAEKSHFIAIRFEGGNRSAAPAKLSNRDGYGAIVEARLGAVTLVREHRAGEGLAAQSSATMLIGTGDVDGVSELLIRWPSGATTRARDVPGGTLVKAFELASEKHGQFVRQPYVPVGDTAAVESASGLERTGLRRDQLEAALDKSLRFFSKHVDRADPSWLSLFGFLKRRFGLDVVLADGRMAHEIRTGVQRSEYYEIFRKIDDPMATVDKKKIADLPHVVDRITASALHCDGIEVPREWIEILGKASRAGGYALTHSALAAEWTVENGCRSRESIGELRREQTALLVDLVARRSQLSPQFEADIDLWIEAMVMLYYTGQSAEVAEEWVADMLARQRGDGGWARGSRESRSDPHPTALAVWVLLENLRQPKMLPWLQRARGRSSDRY